MNQPQALDKALSGRRIYVQLAPDATGRESLVDVQSQLPIPRSGRMLPPEELHMTLIHFGKADDVCDVLHRATGITRDDYNKALQDLIRNFEPLVTDSEYTLMPTGFDGLGKNGHTLVVRYDAPEVLHALHARALAYLKEFFANCGVKDVEAFMANDPNFTYARTMTPHVTLYKGYDGPLPDIELSPIKVLMSKIVY